MSHVRRPGRRPGSPDTRSAILKEARALFADRGFSGTSIRAIAGAASVDPALVHHYFGSKRDLFLAALEIGVDPRIALQPVVEGGADHAGENLLRVFLGVWEQPELRDSLLTLVRGAVDGTGTELLRDGFLALVLGPMGVALELDQPDLRLSLVASQMVGIIMMRYVVRLEPVASMSVEQLVASYAPTLQRYFTGDLRT